MNESVNLIIGISGGTGSGKTTVANRILETVSAKDVVFIQQDSYYRNLKDLPLDYRQLANFDHQGILIFSDPRLLEQMDVKVFVDTPDDVRFIRRLKRDLAERGRTVDSVIEQYLATVRPMHMQFVEPSKRYADVIIPEGGHNIVSIDLISGKIRERLANALATVGGQL